MKSIIKKTVVTAILMGVGVSLLGCVNKNQKTEEDITPPKQEEKGEKEYNKDFARFFNIEDGKTINYSGLGEFGFISTTVKVQNSHEERRITLSNEYLDMGVEESRKSKEDITKESIYIIDSEKVIEKRIDDNENVSMISELIVLKGELKEEKSWNQSVIIKGKLYGAVTTIKSVSEDKKGRQTITTETVVDGVEGYKEDDKYTEIRTYTEGVGITHFSLNYLGYDGGTFEFSYNIVR